MSYVPMVARAREALLDWVDEAGADGRVFMQIQVARQNDAGYELRHVADTGKEREQLVTFEDSHAVAQLTRTTQDGQHRPLRSTPDLRRGWALVNLDGSGLWSALDRIYPGAGLHWFQYRSGTLGTTSYAETAARQTGIYASVGQLGGKQLQAAIRGCCGDGQCLRTPVWAPAPFLEPAGTLVPCREPCSLFISFARNPQATSRGIAHWRGLTAALGCGCS